MQKILIVGDAERIIKRLESILPVDNFKLYFSPDKNDGYKIASRYPPDLILYCCNNGNDDFAFVKKICFDEALSIIPLIVLAEDFLVEKQRAVMDLGADDYLPESLIEKSLFNSVNVRLSKLNRIKEIIRGSISNLDQQESIKDHDDHILVKIGNKLKLVEFSEIACITALKEYSKIITRENSRIVIRKSLKGWIKLLPAKSFLRIHRATIININYIEEITRTNERTYTVHLKNIKDTFDFSYRYANIMRQTFPT